LAEIGVLLGLVGEKFGVDIGDLKKSDEAL